MTLCVQHHYTRNTLKLIAVLTMFLDHIGAILFPGFTLLRMIGRISFPLFCYLIVDGFTRTKNQKKFIVRLFLFALISEPFFNLAFFHSVFFIPAQNIFFLLCSGSMAIAILQKNTLSHTNRCVLIAIIVVMAELLHFDYGAVGVLLILGLYIIEKTSRFQNNLVFCRFTLALLLFSSMAVMNLSILPLFAPLAMLLIPKNPKLGRKPSYQITQLWYVFYPAHLFFLFILSKLLLV